MRTWLVSYFRIPFVFEPIVFFLLLAYHMKCIDPWLIENRRQCPVCKRYVFPDEDNSDDNESNVRETTRTPTEQTPLISNNGNAESHSRDNQRTTGVIFRKYTQLLN